MSRPILVTKELFEEVYNESNNLYELYKKLEQKLNKIIDLSNIYRYARQYNINIKKWGFKDCDTIIGKDGYYDRRSQFNHRKIAERVLGRPLKFNEIVHHIDGDRSNNKNSNLLICTRGYHQYLHARMSYLYQQEHFKEKAS